MNGGSQTGNGGSAGQGEPKPSRMVAIVIASTFALVALGAGLYFWLRPPVGPTRPTQMSTR